MKGEIYPGEYDEFHITSVQGNTAAGHITDSAFSWQVDTKVKVTLKPHEIVQVQMPQGPLRLVVKEYCRRVTHRRDGAQTSSIASRN